MSSIDQTELRRALFPLSVSAPGIQPRDLYRIVDELEPFLARDLFRSCRCVDRSEIARPLFDLLEEEGADLNGLMPQNALPSIASLKAAKQSSGLIMGFRSSVRRTENTFEPAWRACLNFLLTKAGDPALEQIDRNYYRGFHHAAARAVADIVVNGRVSTLPVETARQIAAPLRLYTEALVAHRLLCSFKGLTANRRQAYERLDPLIRATFEGNGLLVIERRTRQLQAWFPAWSPTAYPTEIIEGGEHALADIRVIRNGVFVPENVWRRPEQIVPQDLLRESNVEVRRIMLETIGLERFTAGAETRTIDHDPAEQLELFDAALVGLEGERMTVRIVKCRCPSTGQNYLLTVPPSMTRARAAIAWTFGMEEADYRPLAET